MPRIPLIRSSEYPYHIYNKSNHGWWYSVPLEEVWDMALLALEEANEKYPIKLHSFVLMSNHYHMLASTPDANIDSFMYEFSKGFSLRLRLKIHLANRMFGSRYKSSLITNEKYWWNAYRYIYQNPLRARIVNKVEKYDFSSLQAELGKSTFPIEVTPLNYKKFPHCLF